MRFVILSVQLCQCNKSKKPSTSLWRCCKCDCVPQFMSLCLCVCVCLLFYRHFDCSAHGKRTDAFAPRLAQATVCMPTLEAKEQAMWCENFVIEGCPRRHYIFRMACCEMELFLVNIQNINLFTWCVAQLPNTSHSLGVPLSKRLNYCTASPPSTAQFARRIQEQMIRQNWARRMPRL